jgi:cellobiose transport system permease protein
MIVVILTLTVPNQLGVVALYILMGKLGWNGTLLAVIAPGLVTAFGVFYMRQFVSQAVPDELIEAARMDGALTLRVYWNVVLPAIRPALAVLGLLTFVATWNDFQWPLITLNGTEFPTSMVALSDLASGNYVIYRRVLAGAFVATAPLLLLLLAGGRQIVRGIMEGAVKS